MPSLQRVINNRGGQAWGCDVPHRVLEGAGDQGFCGLHLENDRAISVGDKRFIFDNEDDARRHWDGSRRQDR